MRFLSSWLGPDLAYGVKNTLIAAGLLAAANACGGGGCGGGCAGSSVIPGGFPKDQRVTNAAGVRLTRPGLDFLEANLGPIIQKVLAGGGGSVKGGVMTFEIPESNGKVLSIFDYTICPGGPKPMESPPKCVVEINVAGIKNIKIDSVSPNNLAVKAVVPVRLRNLPIKAIGINMTAGLTKGSAGSCDTGEYVDVPVTADISLESIPDDAVHAARANYTRINIKKMDFDQKTIEDNFKFCGSGIGTSILNALKGLIIGSVIGGLSGQLTGPLANATCMKAQALPDGKMQCPTATFNRGGTCRYADKDDAECVPMLLGMESRFDLSGLLASLSPGTSGGLDFMLASGGNMKPAASGVTLEMFGGAQPQPISNCVPNAPNTLPAGIQVPDELSANTVADWKGTVPPHLGIGIAERYLNHAAVGAYNSGLFCIGISSEQIAQLDAGLFSLLLPSIKGLSDKFNPGDTHPSMGLAIRPQKPPSITVGDNKEDFTSPMLDLKLTDTDLDFYMWSHDRFIRLFTGRIDIRVPINMEAGKEGIGLKFPAKNPLSFTNPRISNNGLLLEKDKDVGKLVESIGGLIPASTFSNIKPFKLDSALASYGLKLTIPPGGIRKLTKGDDRFLGIFASLEVAAAAVPTTKTMANITKTSVDPRNFDLATVGDFPPKVFVHASALEDDGTKTIEYAYKVDKGPWSTFEKTRDLEVTSPFFVLQGKHTIQVVSRVAGLVESEGEPVVLPVTIDVMPPVVSIANVEPGLVKILAHDFVTDDADLQVEARVDGGPWTKVPFTESEQAPQGAGKKKVVARFAKVPVEATSIEVRAIDQNENVASTSAALIRGRADGSLPPGSGCGCSIPGKTDDGIPRSVLAASMLAVIGSVIERRRRRKKAMLTAASASMFVLATGASGCSCAGGAGEDGVAPKPPCNDKANLHSYVIGSHTSAAVGTDGTIWVAGYNEGDPSGGTADDYMGDLVVGKLDKAKGTVDWQVVDGVPQVEPTKNNCGFRGGITDPGDDVGTYTTMALDAQGRPMVAYHDRTNGALRFARFDGEKWSSHDIDQQEKGWAGKFNSMVVVNGKPVIAYQSIEPGAGGYAKAKVRVAKAQSESPSNKGDWTLEDVFVDDKTPCLVETCSTGQKCLAGDKGAGIEPVCAATGSGCGATCTDACVKSPKDGKTECLKARPVLGGYVNSIGLFISLAATSSGDLGLVFYDRFRGNLRGASNKGGKWATTPANAPIDGWVGDAAKDVGTGDRGIGATLAIDATGNWHVAYVDGIKEWLLYKFLPGGDATKGIAPIVVDDGTNADGSAATKFADGQHLIGENAHLVLDGSNVRIVYQDSTGGTLRWAKAQAGAAAKFSRGILKQDGFGGFFPKIIGGKEVLNFYRMKGFTTLDDGSEGDPVIRGDVRLLPLP